MNFSEFKEGSMSKTTPIQQKIRDKTISAKNYSSIAFAIDAINLIMSSIVYSGIFAAMI